MQGKATGRKTAATKPPPNTTVSKLIVRHMCPNNFNLEPKLTLEGHTFNTEATERGVKKYYVQNALRGSNRLARMRGHKGVARRQDENSLFAKYIALQ